MRRRQRELTYIQLPIARHDSLSKATLYELHLQVPFGYIPTAGCHLKRLNAPARAHTGSSYRWPASDLVGRELLYFFCWFRYLGFSAQSGARADRTSPPPSRTPLGTATFVSVRTRVELHSPCDRIQQICSDR